MRRIAWLGVLGLVLSVVAEYAALAVPAWPGVHQLRQPDGTMLRARLRGDEWNHWYETPQGVPLVKDRTGRWVPGARAALKPPRPFKRPAGMRPIRTKAPGIRAAVENAVPVLCINYSDTTTMYTPAQVETSLFANAGNTMRTYYSQASYDLFSVNAGVPGAGGWFTAANPHSTYQYDAGSLLREAVQQADAAGFDFSQYDNDGDGYVDAVALVHQGSGAETGGDDGTEIWSHSSGIWPAEPTNDGVQVSAYVTMPERFPLFWGGQQSTIGVFCHEYGHALGLPDFYDYGYDSEGLGGWSLMAGGSWNGGALPGDTPAGLDAWSRVYEGWVTPIVPTDDVIGASLPQINTSPVMYKLPVHATAGEAEYLLVENRQQVGFDQYIPGSGLCIYHCDDNVWGNDNQWYPGLNPANHYQVALEQADGLWDMEHYNNSGDAADPYPGTTGNRTYDPSSTPNSEPYDGPPAHVAVRNISNSGATMTTDIIPDVLASSKPDLLVRNPDPDTYVGDGVYNNDGTNQTKSRLIYPGQMARYLVEVQNDGTATDDFRMTGPAAGSGWTVTYWDAPTGGNDQTTAVTGAGGWVRTGVGPGASFNMRIDVTPSIPVPAGSVQDVLLTAASVKRPAVLDAVKASATRLPNQPDLLICNAGDPAYIGDAVYTNDGTDQMKTQDAVGGTTVTYPVKVQNDGGGPDNVLVTGPGDDPGWAVRYYDALTVGNDITGQVTGAGYAINNFAPGDPPKDIRIEVTIDPATPLGSVKDILLTASTGAGPGETDAVRATTMCIGAAGPPVLSWAGTPGFEADGVEPGNGAPGDTFTFSVKLQVSDGTEPDFVRLALTKDGAPLPAISMAPVSGTLPAGRIYEAVEQLPVGNYLYHFEAQNSNGPATGEPNQDRHGPDMPAPPFLTWGGGPRFGHDGVDPNQGQANATRFRFRVRYYAYDGDTPGYVHVVIIRNGAVFRTVTMDQIGGADPVTGLAFYGSLKLPPGNYAYRFEAEDQHGQATGEPTAPKVGPVIPGAPYLAWLATGGYKADGVNPDSGQPSQTSFSFRVLYYAYDGDQPTFVRLILRRTGDLFTTHDMTLVAGTDPVTGLTYGFDTELVAGSYTYQFKAADQHGNARGPATVPSPGPLVGAGGSAMVTALVAAPTRGGGAQVTFTLSAAASVTIQVLNVAGRPIAIIARAAELSQGTQTLVWSGCSDSGLAVPSGVYVIRVQARGADGSVSRSLATATIRRLAH